MRTNAFILLCALYACAEPPAIAPPELPPPPDYFDAKIAPIIEARCTSSSGGACHVDDGRGRAQGNLELSSFEAVTRRRDVLRRFGSYPAPILLLKAMADPPAIRTEVEVGSSQRVPLFVRHAGGPVLEAGSEDHRTLAEWLANGATRDGLRPGTPAFVPGRCAEEIRWDLFTQRALDAVDAGGPGYQTFVREVWPILKRSCLGGVCHGAADTNKVPTIELYFTCGDDEQQLRFNYLMARTYSGRGAGQLSDKPLEGAAYHAGGKPFVSTADPRYQALVAWSALDPPLDLLTSEGAAFFEANVQPTLIARGCYFEACHSLANFNFYKPLAGNDGMFGPRVRLHNYLQARFMLGLESSNPHEGRLIAKNLLPRADGIPHRGGALLASPRACGLDPIAVRRDPTRSWHEVADARCVLEAWHTLERGVAVETGQLSVDPGRVGVFVRRPKNSDRAIDFATYRPGADLLRMDLAVDAAGKVVGLARAPTSLLGNCGVDVRQADVRRPDIRGDATEVVFAMRTSASEGLDLWRVGIDGFGCARLGLETGVDTTGTPVHHFDPSYGPGQVILFASTMGDARHPDPMRRYPARTPKWFLPDSNIWVYVPGGRPQRLSYLSGAELAPAMLHTREVVYAVEKATPDFYQISTRAIRLDDGGGYRPQLGQRQKMGFQQVTEVRELVDFRTVFIGSFAGTHFAGGALGVQDLSLGLEELAFDETYFHAVRVLDPRAASRPGVVGQGAYRSPTPLPDGRILVAYAPGPIDLGDPGAAVDYGLYIVDPKRPEERVPLFDTPGQFDIEPAVAFKRIWVPQPNRVHQGDPTRGEFVFHSFPLFAIMMNDNTRLSSRPDERVARIRVLERLPPPEGIRAAEEVASDLHGAERVYEKRRLIGEAPLFADGSLRFLLPANTPFFFELLDAQGNLIDRQREEEQIGRGETQARMIQPADFNGICGGCHNAVDGSETGVIVGADILTSASTRSQASREPAVDLFREPADRPSAPVE